MTPDDLWRAADAIFLDAVERSEAERNAFVRAACGDDADLERYVLELLAADARSGEFLESSVEEYCHVPWDSVFPEGGGEAASTGGEEEAGTRESERLGAYRLVRRIGRGGMASVYLAERADGEFEQRVAIKVLRQGIDTEDVVRRFIAERQILSSLSHPNIARVFDGGATSDGVPYLVMELVDGTPIDEWCDARRASPAERLRLFCDVGRAVQHAHRSLVVHRDLKPSNILVDADGQVKLLDFGIAKLLADEDGMDLTRTGMRAMTPAYASPELVTGEPVTTASDVYQLGLLLCQLLAGRLPYDVGALSPARVERQITEADPARPSTLVAEEHAAARSMTVRELAKRLSGDLDLIVLQALRREPDARYGSAEALVDDVERHLAGEPIRARPDALGYRAAKFIGRHRTEVAVAVVLVLVLIGSAIISGVHARRLAIERDRAVEQEMRAHRVTGFLADMFRVVDPNETAGEPIDAVDLLQRGAERARTELADDPAALAEVFGAIGEGYLRRGLKDPAIPILEAAVEIRRERGDPEPLVEDLRRLASATDYQDEARSIDLLTEAVSVAERNLGAGHVLVAAALTDQAEILAQRADRQPRADSLIERALSILRNHPGDVRPQLASTLHLSALGHGMTRFDRMQEALAILIGLHGEDHTAVAATLNDMGLAQEPSDPAAADSLLERAAEINVRIHGPYHHQSLAILNNLAGRYRDRGDHAKAAPLYRTVLERRRDVYPEAVVPIAFTLHGLGWSLAELGQGEEAEELLREAVDILAVNNGGDENLLVQVARSALGRAVAVQGRYEEAEPLLRQSYEWVAANSPTPSFIPFMLDRLIGLYDDWGRPAAAAELRVRKTEYLSSLEEDAG